MTTSKFKKWVADLPINRKRSIADEAGTSVALLRQLASGHRGASSELAGRIESACDGEVLRGDINATCRNCQYYKGRK